jgi:hypothetical protein
MNIRYKEGEKMLVLKIIGVALALFLLYKLVMKINEYTNKKYSHIFFDEITTGVYIAIYAAIYLGYQWYLNALETSNDPLNGLVVISIGILTFICILIYNIKRTKFLFGLVFTFIQAVLLIPFCLIGVLMILGLLALALDAKPVYHID